MEEMTFITDANGVLHNENGPAVIHSDGYQAWYLNGLRHRDGGPAVVYPEMKLEAYYINGVNQNTEI